MEEKLPKETTDTLNELRKDAYEFELDRKDKLIGRLGVPIGAVTLLASASLFFIRSGTSEQHPTLTSVSLCTAVLSLLSLAVAAGFLLATISVEKYRYIDVPASLEVYLRDCQAFNRQTLDVSQHFELHNELQTTLKDQYDAAIAHNIARNDQRTSRVVIANRAITASMVLLAIATTAYYPAQRNAKPSVTLVKLVDSQELVDIQEKDMKKYGADVPAPAASTDSKPSSSTSPGSATPPAGPSASLAPAPEAAVRPQRPQGMIRSEASVREVRATVTEAATNQATTMGTKK